MSSMRVPTMIGFSVLALLATASCYREYEPAAPVYQPQPTVVYGPPGGGMDPVDGAYGGAAGGYSEEMVEPSSDPQAPGYVMGTVTDAEIDTTLQPYGEWVEVEGYGRVWRPYTTVVGVDFTPYETCGSWVWTDYGWTFTCDWDWGWLPFHYGQWAFVDTGWYWVPDYTWSPAWVDWRYGSGYVGWRPSRPRVVDHRDDRLRDHRTPRIDGPRIRDHRNRSGDADWRFTHERDFGRGRIRGNLFRNPAEGLRVTSTVARPPVRTDTRPVRAATLMKSRLGVRYGASRAWAPSSTGGRPAYDRPARAPYDRPNYSSSRPYDRPAYSPQRPTYTDPSRPGGYDRPTRPSFDRPTRTYDRPTPPSRPSYDRPTYTPPSRPSYDRPTYTPPARPTHDRPSSPPSRPSYDRPTYTPPSRPTYDRPTYTPPARSTYDRPSSPPSRPSYDRPSPPPARSWTPPSSSNSGSRGWTSGSSSSSNSGSRWGGSSSSGSSHRSSPPSSGGSSRGSSSSSHGGGGGRRR